MTESATVITAGRGTCRPVLRRACTMRQHPLLKYIHSEADRDNYDRPSKIYGNDKGTAQRRAVCRRVCLFTSPSSCYRIIKNHKKRERGSIICVGGGGNWTHSRTHWHHGAGLRAHMGQVARERRNFFGVGHRYCCSLYRLV